MLAKCYLHPREEAAGKCDVCKKPVCRKCAKKTEGKLICRNCQGKKPGSAVDTDELERQERIEKAKEASRRNR
ncbi:MAG: hypothetical protein A4E28_00558 [Methanocella sp. PtaU1.Bin125]|nr:MAG: hypothetical protein A4E28_00558 [Methanocella sp. PtaU1.Bin125]